MSPLVNMESEFDSKQSDPLFLTCNDGFGRSLVDLFLSDVRLQNIIKQKQLSLQGNQ